MLCIQKGEISPMSLHIAASDISLGHNCCCVFNTVYLHITASEISQAHSWCCIVKMVQYNDDAYNNNNSNNYNNNNIEVNMTRMSA